MTIQPILIVDDDPDVRSMMGEILCRKGYEVESVSCAVTALDRYKTGDFSMVITDVRMPKMSGMELLGEIKRVSPQMPVIMVTGFGGVQNAVEAMRDGASDYLLKPFSPQALESAVKRACLRKKDSSHSVSPVSDPQVTASGREIITQDHQLQQILQMAENVAASMATVLIQGESGTGKELLARYIHANSYARKDPYVAVNCSALPDTLAESELFGHEKGSFTGAINHKAGKFELAARGTIVLDEISEMSLPLQAKILRVLQERQVDRIGGSRPLPMEARVIAISNVDLKEAMEQGKFRKDLYYRVNVVPLTIPPLRERRGDIPLLVSHFLNKFSSVNNKGVLEISKEAIEIISKHDWPGNIRELENTIERAVLICSEGIIGTQDLILDVSDAELNSRLPFRIKAGYSVKEMEKDLIFTTLNEVNDNRTQAAELLGISIRTLRNKLNEYKEANAEMHTSKNIRST